jgi:hypothetical protein
MGTSQKEMVEELRMRWKAMWQERVDDKLRAEGVATADYCDLFVEKGTILHATRDFKALNFKEILEQYQVSDVDRFVPADPQVGGWRKFVKVNITNQPSRKRRQMVLNYDDRKVRQQLKKGGRGWLHL